MGDVELKVYITNYYKGLFKPPNTNNFSLVECQTHDIPQVPLDENNFLTTPFTEKEVRDAVFQMEITRSRWFPRKILSSVLGHHKGGPFGDVH